MAPSLSPEAITSLKQTIENATTSTSTQPSLPGALLHIIDFQNNTLFTHGASSVSPTPPTSTSILDVQSLTKLIGAIAYMRLVDAGLASLDDAFLIKTHLPELASKQVLTGFTTLADGTKEWQFEDQKGSITPRMLLNHTYGGGHTFFSTLLLSYFQDRGIWEKTNESGDVYGTLLAAPLVNQPGTKTEYGSGLDWIAVLIERITQRELAGYLDETIFQPLGLKSTGVLSATQEPITAKPGNKTALWPWVLRTPPTYTPLAAAQPFPVDANDIFPTGTYHTGRLGTGLLTTAAEYTRLLSILLPQNAGRDPVSGTRILSPSSVTAITTPQLPPHLRNHSRHIPTSGLGPFNLPGALDAPDRDPEGSYGLACAVQGARRVLGSVGAGRGRGEGSVYWYGLANSEVWVDGEEGIVVFLDGNFFPWNDEVWVGFVAEVEGVVYEGLKR